MNSFNCCERIAQTARAKSDPQVRSAQRKPRGQSPSTLPAPTRPRPAALTVRVACSCPNSQGCVQQPRQLGLRAAAPIVRVHTAAPIVRIACGCFDSQGCVWTGSHPSWSNLLRLRFYSGNNLRVRRNVPMFYMDLWLACMHPKIPLHLCYQKIAIVPLQRGVRSIWLNSSKGGKISIYFFHNHVRNTTAEITIDPLASSSSAKGQLRVI